MVNPFDGYIFFELRMRSFVSGSPAAATDLFENPYLSIFLTIIKI
jgi:hypothetical protein